MKLKDILKNKVLYFRDTDCHYYWDYKYIVEIDKDTVALINHNGSQSGYYPLFIEFVDEAFVSAFFEKRFYNRLDDFKCLINENHTLQKYIYSLKESEYGDYQDFGELDVIPIDIKYVQEQFNEFRKSIGRM